MLLMLFVLPQGLAPAPAQRADLLGPQAQRRGDAPVQPGEVSDIGGCRRTFSLRRFDERSDIPADWTVALRMPGRDKNVVAI